MLGGIQSLDDKIRAYMAQQAKGQLEARRQAVMSDLSSMLQSSPETAAKRVGARYGVDESHLGDLEQALQGRSVFGPAANASQMMRETAEREAAQNPLYRLQSMLAGTSKSDRAGQVGFYGAAAGGGVAGLTAAGQGLMALMEYMQESMATQGKRDEPLA